MLDQNQDKPFWFVKVDVAKPCLKLSALLTSLSETEPERRSSGMKSRNEMKVKRDVSCTSTLHYSELRGAESNPLDFRAAMGEIRGKVLLYSYVFRMLLILLLLSASLF